MTVIKVEKLSKKIKDKEILRNISFEINDGECVALIGPNGAGKTTLIDCLLGDKFMSSGQVVIQGFAPTDPRLKQLISILPQENTVVQDLKVKELLSFFQSIYPNSLSNQEIDDYTSDSGYTSSYQSEYNLVEEQNVEKTASHHASKHIRNLPEGHNASAEKIATAEEHGFSLGEGQTWVDDY